MKKFIIEDSEEKWRNSTGIDTEENRRKLTIDTDSSGSVSPRFSMANFIANEVTHNNNQENTAQAERISVKIDRVMEDISLDFSEHE